MVGFFSAAIARAMRWSRRILPTEVATPPPPISFTSMPAQKASPAPVSMTARAASSSASCSNAVHSCSRISMLMAFFLSGRLMVTVATPRSTPSSIAMPLLRCIARRLACRNEASGSKQPRRYSQGRCSAVKGVMRDIARSSGLQLVDLPEPGPPAPGEVLVRMAMAPINPADRLTIAGRYQPLDEVPELLGAEGAGLVEACGRGVRGVEAGDQVLLMTRGNWVGRRRVPADDVVR